MDDAEPCPWTLTQHLAGGSTAIAKIEADQLPGGPEPVCHHFVEANPVDPMEGSVEARYRHLVSLFASAGVDFLPDRLEAWETVDPDHEWLLKRIPAIVDAATVAGFEYIGWTWEPRDRQAIGSSDIRVINNRIV